jgi:hypothetical protein
MEGLPVLLKFLQFLVRSMFYVFITWHRFVPDGSSRSGRRSGGPSDQAKGGA